MTKMLIGSAQTPTRPHELVRLTGEEYNGRKGKKITFITDEKGKNNLFNTPPEVSTINRRRVTCESKK